MSAAALHSPPSWLLCPAGPPAVAPLQHYSLESPETGKERMETKISHQREKECQEEQNWGKKERKRDFGLFKVDMGKIGKEDPRCVRARDFANVYSLLRVFASVCICPSLFA